MKKNLLITVLTISCALSVMYGYKQREAAESFRLKALENEILAKENLEMAHRNQLEALRQRQIAELEMARSARALQDAEIRFQKKQGE